MTRHRADLLLMTIRKASIKERSPFSKLRKPMTQAHMANPGREEGNRSRKRERELMDKMMMKEQPTRIGC